MTKFHYQGSLIHCHGHSSRDVNSKIAFASRACGALQESVFVMRHLHIHIERCVFNACVMSLLLYGSECWIPLQSDIRHLSIFTRDAFTQFLIYPKSKRGGSVFAALTCWRCGMTWIRFMTSLFIVGWSSLVTLQG